MIVLTHRDMASLIDMRDCIAVVGEALRDLASGKLYQPLRVRFRADGMPNRFVLLPAARVEGRRLWALKEIVVTPGNGARGLGPHQGTVLLHDGDEGTLLAVMDAAPITALRTAAATAVATRALARKRARKVAILGTGEQARAHADALRCVLHEPEITVWGRSPDKAQRLADDLGTAAAGSVEQAVAGADVVCTVTASAAPLVRRDWLAAGCHVNAVGSSLPTARELDGATLAAATLFVDRRESAVNEAGDYLLALEEGAIAEDHIRAELGEVLTGAHPGRTTDDELTVFKSLGFASQDLAAAELIYERALVEGCGTRVDW